MNWICWTNVSSDKVFVHVGANTVHLQDFGVPVVLMVLKPFEKKWKLRQRKQKERYSKRLLQKAYHALSFRRWHNGWWGKISSKLINISLVTSVFAIFVWIRPSGFLSCNSIKKTLSRQGLKSRQIWQALMK